MNYYNNNVMNNESGALFTKQYKRFIMHTLHHFFICIKMTYHHDPVVLTLIIIMFAVILFANFNYHI